MSDASLISVTGLRKTFVMGREMVHALAGADLAIERNSFTAVIGPSGSGKSTLLYLLGGLDRPSAGSITINGQALEKMDENALALFRRKTVGFVFQSFNLVSSMTALENVAFPMRLAGVGRGPRLKRAQMLLKEVGLENRAYHKPTELSGGQQQRVAIARALINDPQLILADEPTGNLDTHSGVTIIQMLVELHKQGRTVVMVTHDPRLTRFATHTIRFLDGRVVTQEEYDLAAEIQVAGEA